MNRILNLDHKGVRYEISLFVSDPFESEGMYYCEWNCDIIHPQTLRIGGPDELGALYYCLSFIGNFFARMRESDFHVWLKDENDNGGFDFGGVPGQ